MKSTSFHKITADGGTLFYKIMARLLYFPLNFLNNLHPNSKLDKDLKITKLRINDVEKLEKQYNSLNPIFSPSRKLSDLFWMNLNWKEIENELGELKICDLGCGSGRYFEVINSYSSNRITNYFGIDIQSHKNWEDIKANKHNTNFATYDGEHLRGKIPEQTNLIISQSAIEHFINDIAIFEQIKGFIENVSHPVHQVHLFPSAACLKLFRFHGVRQYTPRTISKITSIFGDGFTKELICLGGENANKTHMKYVKHGILGKDLRKKKTEEYNKTCFSAIVEDLKQDSMSKVNFYALIIKSNKE